MSLPGIETLIGGVTTREGGLKRTGHTAQRICEVNVFQLLILYSLKQKTFRSIQIILHNIIDQFLSILIIYHKQFLHPICPNNPLFCHRQRTVGYSGHFDRKTRSPYTLQDVGKYILIFNIIISMQDNKVSGTYVEKYQFFTYCS